MAGLFVFLIGAFVLLIGFLVYFYRKDRRFMRARTREALAPLVRKEISEEIGAAKKRQQKFKHALEIASKLAESQDNSLTSRK